MQAGVENAAYLESARRVDAILLIAARATGLLCALVAQLPSDIVAADGGRILGEARAFFLWMEEGMFEVVRAWALVELFLVQMVLQGLLETILAAQVDRLRVVGRIQHQGVELLLDVLVLGMILRGVGAHSWAVVA